MSKSVSFARTCVWCGGIGAHKPECDKGLRARPRIGPNNMAVVSRAIYEVARNCESAPDWDDDQEGGYYQRLAEAALLAAGYQCREW